MPSVHFLPQNRTVEATVGTSLLDAAARAGIDIVAPCGGEGTCGQCRVRIETGQVECVQRGCLTPDEIAQGTVLACSSRITTDVTVHIPDQAAVETLQIVTDAAGHRAADTAITVEPLAIRRFLCVDPPTADHPRSDMERLTQSLGRESLLVPTPAGMPSHEPPGEGSSPGTSEQGFSHQHPPAPRLSVLRTLAETLRAQDHRITATLAPCCDGEASEIIRLEPGDTTARQLGLAIDVGTTTCAVRLVDLSTGRIIATAADYNGQLARGADVISRINYARTPQRAEELRRLILDTLNGLISNLCTIHHLDCNQIDNVVIVGNTTMIHLLLGLPPEYIRLSPYTPTINRPPVLAAREIGLAIHAEAAVLFAPGVGSYVGGDITAGLLQTALAADGEAVRLFLDFGTNGEVVIGNGEWLMACAASAGPAFEGGGVSCGMRAMAGAIESVRIDPATRRPAVSVIGGGPPEGLCGSGLVDLLAEMTSAGLIDPSGKFLTERLLPERELLERESPSLERESLLVPGDSGRNPAWTIIPAADTRHGRPITISEHDIANLLRTKAAVYSACAVMLKSVGLDFDAIVEVYVAGGFGRYLNLEKSIAIGLLPDLPRERFTYLGNSALTGAHALLCSAAARRKVIELADRLTYVELNADPAYMSEYTAALFLPHTDSDRFPTVKRKRG